MQNIQKHLQMEKEILDLKFRVAELEKQVLSTMEENKRLTINLDQERKSKQVGGINNIFFIIGHENHFACVCVWS